MSGLVPQQQNTSNISYSSIVGSAEYVTDMPCNKPLKQGQRLAPPVEIDLICPSLDYSISSLSLNETTFTPPCSTNTGYNSKKNDGKPSSHWQNVGKREKSAKFPAVKKESSNSNDGRKSAKKPCRIDSRQVYTMKKQKNIFADFMKDFTEDLKELDPSRCIKKPSKIKFEPQKKTSFHGLIKVAEYCMTDAPSVVSSKATSVSLSSFDLSDFRLQQKGASAERNQNIWSTTLDSGVKLVDIDCYHLWSSQERCRNSHNATWSNLAG